MPPRSIVRIAALAIQACAISAYAAPGTSLCAKDEQVAFSCHVGAKIASLCASPDLSPDQGWVQYRFGKKGAVELTYPAVKEHPRKYFRWGVNGYSGGGTDYFRFSNGGYDYVVYSGFGKGWTKEGVAVEKDGKRVASLVCKDAALDGDNWKIMYSAKLPQIPGGNEFDMP
jgi:hypothetical protein